MIDYKELKKTLLYIGNFCYDFNEDCDKCPLKISKKEGSCIFMSPDFTNDVASNACYEENVKHLIAVLKKAEKLKEAEYGRSI